jgi:hypothetical protein
MSNSGSFVIVTNIGTSSKAVLTARDKQDRNVNATGNITTIVPIGPSSNQTITYRSKDGGDGEGQQHFIPPVPTGRD